MAWVQRNEDQQICGVLFAGPSVDAGINEQIANDDPELLAFLDQRLPVLPVLLPEDQYANETLPEYVRRRTWSIRAAGCSVNGVLVRTDNQSLLMITGMHALALSDPQRTFKFDLGDQVIELDATQAVQIATAVADYVQSTFDKRAELLAAIEAGTITTKEQIDAELE